MKLLSLDVASTTGWCLYKHLGPGKAPRISCGSWKCGGGDFDGCAETLSDHLTALLKAERLTGDPVAYAAIESPLRVMPKASKSGLFGEQSAMASNPHTMLVLHAMSGSACAILRQFRVPKRMVTPNTWRKSFLGEGTKPPASIPKGKTSQWWKREVRQAADLLGDRYGFKVPNNDASDAIGIACWLAANVAHMAAEDDLRRRAA